MAAKKAKRGSKKKGKAPARGRSREVVPEAEDVLVIPVRNMILFPGVVLPLMISRERSIEAVQQAVREKQQVGLFLQRDEQMEAPGPDDLYGVGTLAEIMRYWTAPDGNHHAICQGNQRIRILRYTETEPLLKAEVEIVTEVEPDTKDIEARFVALKQQADEVLQLHPTAPEDLAPAVRGVESPSMMADMVATFMDAPAVEKQQVLETFDLKRRLDRVSAMLGEFGEVLKLSQKIRQKTKGSLDKAQKEYWLREQLRAIQIELGEGEDAVDELAALKTQVQELELGPDALKEVTKELRRLERTPEQAAEYSMIRTYLDVFLELPWNTATTDRLDLARARKILDEDHYGLEKVKRRILEFLAVRKLNPEGKGPTLCLVGPPGVGKTSLGKSVARALGRKFVRVSLGGVHDEAEIRGHRRTYVGAMLGNVLTGLKNAGSNNPVFMLDEMDKLSAGLHGDPSSALLEVLDPAQNHTFRDNYLGVPFDLRHVLFIGTANVLEGIPGPLRDRLEVIHLSGYTEEEKLQIARRYLVGRQREACGLKTAQCQISSAALREVVRYYTREAGVRNLEREIGALCRHAATRVARRKSATLRVDAEKVRQILGPRRFESELAMRTASPGVATGLAWTPVGGEILFIEASRMAGKGTLILTGQLGDVMKESAQTALSLMKTRAESLGIDPQLFEKHDLHLHVPAGAVPKDGPSAGVAMFAALASLLTERRVRSDLAMTGEISLRGLVLPVGGVKEKVLAALAAGIKVVLLPARNRHDLREIPRPALAKLRIVWLETVDDALKHAFESKKRR